MRTRGQAAAAARTRGAAVGKGKPATSAPPVAVPPPRRAASRRARAKAAPLSPAALPPDVLSLICSRLSGWELSRCVNVCKSWRAALIADPALWRAALSRDFADGTRALALARTRTLVPAHQLRMLRAVPSRLRRGASTAAAGFEGMPALQGFAKLRNHGSPAGLPPSLAAPDAAAPSDSSAPRAWGAVRAVERVTWRYDVRPGAPLIDGQQQPLPRAHMLRAHAALWAWYTHLARPYKLVWRTPPAVGADGGDEGAMTQRGIIAHRPRRLQLPASLRDGAAAPGADYALYQAFAAALLRGRCRVCNRETHDVHATLRVPMCARRQCAGAYPRPAQQPATVAADAAAARRPAWRPRNAGKRGAKPAAAGAALVTPTAAQLQQQASREAQLRRRRARNITAPSG
jgi:hypothetical protein